jgi:hypothetical protein
MKTEEKEIVVLHNTEIYYEKHDDSKNQDVTFRVGKRKFKASICCPQGSRSFASLRMWVGDRWAHILGDYEISKNEKKFCELIESYKKIAYEFANTTEETI